MTPKALVSTLAGILIFFSAAGIVWFITNLGFQKIESQMTRFGLTCALSISLIRGWKPGRWIAIVLLLLGGIGGAIGGLLLEDAGNAGFFLVGLGALYIGFGAVLLTPFVGRHFAAEPPQAAEPLQKGAE